MKIDHDKYDVFIFDLDRTLWDTKDRYDQDIWAKQLIPPFKLNHDVLIDDVFSYCKLRPGVIKYLTFLTSKEKQIGFLSNGKLWGTMYADQPSVQTMIHLGIYHFFNFKRELLYKTSPKFDRLKNSENCVFFDDNDQVLAEVSKLKNVKTIDSKLIEDWSDLI